MVNIAALFKLIDDERAALAVSAIERPQGQDAFAYGRVVGIYAGLTRARQLIDDFISDKETKDNAL